MGSRTVDDSTLDELLARLGDPDPSARVAAADDLAELRDPRAVRALIKALDDPYVRYSRYPEEREDVYGGHPVREAAARALAQIGDGTFVGTIAERLRLDDDSAPPEYRRNKKRDAVTALVGIARTTAAPGGDVRRQRTTVVRHVAALLDADDPPREAAEVLAQIGDPSAVSSLIAAAEREGSKAGGFLIDALERIGGPEAERFLTSYRRRYGVDEVRDTLLHLIHAVRSGRSDRERLARKVVSFGQEATVPLIELVGHEDSLVRWQAAQCLGKIGDIRAVVALDPLLDDADAGVQEMAAWALERIGGPEAESILAARRPLDPT
jgi:HEAT repeat protein